VPSDAEAGLVKPASLGTGAAFDAADPRLIEDPYPAFAALRELGPVWRSTADGRWYVSAYAEASSCFRDRRLGRIFWHRYSHQELGIDPAEPGWNDPRWADFAAFERWELLALEPPEHTRLRRLVTQAFTPRAVEALRSKAQARARRLLAEAAEAAHGGAVDIVADVAQPLSLGIICDLIGVPRSERQIVLGLSHRVVRMYEPAPSESERADANDAAGDFRRLVLDRIAERRARPEADLLGALMDASVDGERLSDEQIASTAMVLLMAGHEATVNATGNGVAALAAHPGEWQRVRIGEVSPRVAVEEVLRWDPPLHLFERWVLEDGFRLGEVELPRGSRVALLLGAANRDPLRFRDPDRFDAARGDTGHLSFGGGIHFCLGAPLARLEIEVVLTELAARHVELALAAVPVRRQSFQFRGYEHLLIA